MPVPIINPLRLLSELISSAGTIATIDIAIAFKTLHKIRVVPLVLELFQSLIETSIHCT